MWAFIKRFFAFKLERDLYSEKLYEQIVNQARHPSFYLDFRVPDTVRGRFEMVALHLFIVLFRLKHVAEIEKVMAAKISQQLCDMMVADTDHSLRDLHVTDSTVHKSIPQAVEGFYGRLVAYDRAVLNDDPRALRDVIARNIYGDLLNSDLDIIESLSEYVVDVIDFMQRQSIAHLTFDEGFEEKKEGE